MLYITKRDGRKEPFNKRKIERAMEKAYLQVDGEIDDYAEEKIHNIADFIEHKVQGGEDLGVEEIQDLVENGLMNTRDKDVARAYIIYRNDRTRKRQANTALMKVVKEKITASNVQNQNANVDERSFGGRKGEASNEVIKQIALDEIMSKMARENHLNNMIYTHDLDSYALGMHNCLTLPLDDLLANGFNTRQTDIRPAGSINTAFQLVAVLFQIQSLQQFGGVSASHIDWTMVPYVRKSFKKHLRDGAKYIARGDAILDNLLASDEEIRIDDPFIKENYPKIYEYAYDMTVKETNQAVEGMYHNLNSLQSRSGNQLPFSSINYGTCTLPEGRLVTKAILDGSIKGIGKLHRTSIFPCGIFQMMKGVNREPGDPNYDLYRLALESTSKRLYPNYANCDWSGNAGYDPKDPRTYFSTMGKRKL